jgi:hypothetical protein
MPRLPLIALLAACVCAASAPAYALTAAPPPKAYIYTGFDPDYLYFAARVEDPFVVGTHSEPMSEAWNDDAVGFYLDLPRLRTEGPHPRCCRLVVSAAGGFMASVGAADGSWQPAPEWMRGLKLDVSVQGTLNKPDDVDEGFTIEVAIPWRFLGDQVPPDRAEIGFNAVCFVRGENEAFVSWSPDVKTEADLDRPGAWGTLLMRRSGGPGPAGDRQVICPLLMQRILIDARLSAEWLGASVITLVKPEPRPLAATAKATARTAAGLVCGLYRCDYQADPRLGPVVGPGAPGVAGRMVNQPMTALGPWLCAERVDWHRRELTEVAQAGLDAILPVVAPGAAGGLTPRRGLSAMARALQELRGRRVPCPLVGLYLDLSTLPELDPARVSAAVIEFFRTVPQEFWIQLDPESGPGPGRQRLAVLGPPGSVGAVDRNLLAEVSRAFAAEFPGNRLVWLADLGWRDKSLENVTAYCGLDGPDTLNFQANENYPTAVISPGYDDGVSPMIVDRLEGSRYESAWTKALALGPRLIILRSWNDFTHATELAASRQYGVRYVDLTRRFTAQWASGQPRRLRLLRETLPAVLEPGSEYQADLLLQNASLEPLGTSEAVSAGYRIEDETGRTLAEVKSAYALHLLSGQTRTIAVPVAMRNDLKAPLPQGRYRIVFEMLSNRVPLLSSHWFQKSIAEARVWVTVGAPPARAMTVLEASLPTRMESGADYPVRLRLRNDGSATWSKDSVAVAAAWYRRPASPALQPELLGEAARLRLPRTAAPGEVLDLHGNLRAAIGNQPVPPGIYELRWDLIEGSSPAFAGPRAPACGAAVEVVARDAGALFVKSDSPGAIEVGSTTPVKVVVTNAGLRTWEPKTTQIVSHWAYWDGSETAVESSRAALEQAIKPGASGVVTVALRAPQAGGAYWLWFDVAGPEGALASVADEAGAGSLMPTPVLVRGGPYLAVDLAKQANLAIAAPDTRRVVGNFDGRGNSLPSELVPPDVGLAQVTAYPSGYYTAAQHASPPEREVEFAYPARSQGRIDGLACRGQQIALPAGRMVRLHLLGAGAEADVSGEFTVTYADGSSAALPLTMSDWRGEALHGEGVALSLSSFRSPQATQRGPAHLYHYVLGLDAGKEAKTLTLPNDRRLVVAAITAETAP